MQDADPGVKVEDLMVQSFHWGNKLSLGDSARETPGSMAARVVNEHRDKSLTSRGSVMPVAVAVTTAITCASGRCLGGCWGCRGTRKGGFIILLSLGCVSLSGLLLLLLLRNLACWRS